jgi:hypothetical protein
MKDPYNEYIERRGKYYRYDPDYDCYYAVPQELSTFDKYGWIAVIIVLAILAYALDHFR